MGRLAAVHTELSFDDEGNDGEKKMRSCTRRVALDLR